MKIQYCSDLHLEFPRNLSWLKDNPIKPIGDIMIIAGDTFHLGKGFKSHSYIDWLSDNFQKVYLLPGNHEYYGGFDVFSSCQELKEQLRENVWLVNNTVIELDDVEIVFSILWSKIEKHAAHVVIGMNDFRLIRFEGWPLTVENYNGLFDKCWKFLKHQISEPTSKKRVVVTHHLPSRLCNAKEFIGSKINEGFCTDLTSDIENAIVDYWIYGHSHRNIPAFKIGAVMMITNQLGYVQTSEHKSFDLEAFITV